MPSPNLPKEYLPVSTNDERLRAWLQKYQDPTDTLKATVTPEIYAAGQIYFVPLSGDLSTTLRLTENDPNTTIAKGADHTGEHVIVIARSESLTWAANTKPPRAELTAFDTRTNDYCPADPGNTLRVSTLVSQGLGKVALVGIIGPTYTRGGFMNKDKTTTGILIWANPQVTLTSVTPGFPTQEQH